MLTEKNKKKKLTEAEEQSVFDAFETQYLKTDAVPRFAQRHIGRTAPAAGSFRQTGSEEFIRVRLPKPNLGEVLGIILEHFGSKLLVKCMDGFTRTCRIPGKIRYKLRVKPGDIILVKKWTVQSNEKGDYLYKYKQTQVNHLVRKGFLKKEDVE